MAGNKLNRKVLTQRHVSSRMNFLYQAANLMAQSSNNTLAAHYAKLCRNVGTKALMRIAPALKRTLCKRCSLPLLPGVNTMLLTEEAQKPQQTKQAKLPKQQSQEPHQSQQLEQPQQKEQQQQMEQSQQIEQTHQMQQPDQLHQPEQSQQQHLKEQPAVDANIQKTKPRNRRLRGKRNKGQKGANTDQDANVASQKDKVIIDEHIKVYLECSLCRGKRTFCVDTQKECWPERSNAIVQVITLDK